jgi:hypothetical protein
MVNQLFFFLVETISKSIIVLWLFNDAVTTAGDARNLMKWEDNHEWWAVTFNLMNPSTLSSRHQATAVTGRAILTTRRTYGHHGLQETDVTLVCTKALLEVTMLNKSDGRWKHLSCSHIGFRQANYGPQYTLAYFPLPMLGIPDFMQLT